MTQGLVFDIRHFSLHDGPGIRTSVFLKGCPLACCWCHNPEGLSLEPVKVKKKVIFDSAVFNVHDTCGVEMDIKSLMKEIEKDILFYDTSGGGVTFTGGEPLCQPEFLMEALLACREKEIHTCIDTSGYIDSLKFSRIANNGDLWLYDIKIMDKKKHKEYTGQDNKVILDNLIFLDEKEIDYIVRIPLIPDLTMNTKNITAIGHFLSGLKNLKKISLLPYHKTGNEKYRKFNIKNKCSTLELIPHAEIAKTAEYLRSFGWNVLLGE